jgi:methyl-accepting chemotaxis protein
MAKSVERSGYFKSHWLTLARIAFTAIFFYWLYLIWTSTADLNVKLDATTDRITATHNIQVEFKNEVQLWKDLLLRSNSRETLQQNWNSYEAQYLKVAAEAERITTLSDVRAIRQQMKSFIDAHAVNHEKYKNSVDLLIKNKFDSTQADAAVKGIDQPIQEYLEVVELDMLSEERRIKDGLIAKARNQIEQSLFALAFIGLLAVWLPKH